MTDPVYDGLAEGLKPADTIPSRDLALIGIDAKLGRLEELQERAVLAAERQADAFEVIAALLASVTGVANAWCPGGSKETVPVNYIRASADGNNFQCDRGDDDED
jgi:hypothetical protein